MLTRADKTKKYITEFKDFFEQRGGYLSNDELLKFLRFKTPGLVLDFDSLYDGFFDGDKKVFSNKLYT